MQALFIIFMTLYIAALITKLVLTIRRSRRGNMVCVAECDKYLDTGIMLASFYLIPMIMLIVRMMGNESEEAIVAITSIISIFAGVYLVSQIVRLYNLRHFTRVVLKVDAKAAKAMAGISDKIRLDGNSVYIKKVDIGTVEDYLSETGIKAKNLKKSIRNQILIITAMVLILLSGIILPLVVTIN